MGDEAQPRAFGERGGKNCQWCGRALVANSRGALGCLHCDSGHETKGCPSCRDMRHDLDVFPDLDPRKGDQ